MEQKIKAYLGLMRSAAAESRLLHEKIDAEGPLQSEEHRQCLEKANSRLALMQSWLLLLTEDESYVICRHLIDGIDWARIMTEYKERWGEENTKTERTLKAYQKRGLKKIAVFTSENMELLNFE